MADFEEATKIDDTEKKSENVSNDVKTVDNTSNDTITAEVSNERIESPVEATVLDTPIVEASIGVRNVEPKEVEVDAVNASKVENEAKFGKNRKDKKKKDKKTETEVVEVANIPSEVVSTKDSKKLKKVTSFLAFTIIVLTLIFSIVDWTVSSVTRDPQVMLHLMDWIVIILYLFIAIKALSFIKGKKKWVKVVYVICVIATIVCILVPMIMDYIDLSKAIKAEQQAKNILAMIF